MPDAVKDFFASKKTIIVDSGCAALVDLVYAWVYNRFRFIKVLCPVLNPVWARVMSFLFPSMD